MTTRISTMTDGVNMRATDQVEAARSGASVRVPTPCLVAIAHTSANHTYAAGLTIINFDTVDFDPSSTITTGASWAFTAQATGYYELALENGYVFANSANWLAGESMEVDLFKAGSNFQDVDFYPFPAAVTFANLGSFVLHGPGTVHLTSGQAANLRLSNDTSSSRILSDLTQIVIKRVG